MLRYDSRWSGCDPLLRPCSVYDPFLRRSGSAGHCFTRSPLSVPTKTRNDLKRPITNKKRPTVSKTPLAMTWPYLQGVKKRRETTNNKQIFRLFYNIGQYVLFSNMFSTQHLVAIIRALLHGESWWKQSLKCHASSVNYHEYFLRDIRFIFFFLGFVSAEKGKGYYFSSSLPLASALQIVRPSAFAFFREVWWWTRTSQAAPGTVLHFFIIKASIRVNKGAGFLDLLLNINFQPLIIVVKHSIIKLDVTELLDSSQVFTCWESQWLFCFMNTIFVLKVYFF